MRSYRRAFARAIAVVLALSAAASVSAQPTLPLGVWTTFRWFDAVGPIDDPSDSFFVSILDPARVRITDALHTGDAFDVRIAGVLRLATPSVPGGINTGAADGDAAWADARLSKGEFLLGQGSYRLDVEVRVDAGFGAGEGFIRVDPAGPVQVIPEPATLLLVGTGLFGIAGTARRRRRQGGTRRTPTARGASGR